MGVVTPQHLMAVIMKRYRVTEFALMQAEGSLATKALVFKDSVRSAQARRVQRQIKHRRNKLYCSAAPESNTGDSKYERATTFKANVYFFVSNFFFLFVLYI